MISNQVAEDCRGKPAPVPTLPPLRNRESTVGPIWSIHYLRALSAFGVVMFHSLDGTRWDFPFGASGIHLFFVISGFLMWTVTQGRPVRPARFFIERILRIAPLYWMATAVAVSSTFVMPGFFWQSSHDPLVVIRSLLFIPQHGSNGGVYPVLYQGWTLQYEIFFYALFSACLLLPRKRQILGLTIMMMGLAAGSLQFGDTQDPFLTTYLNPICLEFLGGCWAAYMLRRPLENRLALALLIGASASFWFAVQYEDRLGDLSSVAIALSASSIVFSIVALERGGRIPQFQWLRFLGEASYSIYLFQTLAFAVVAESVPNLPVALRVVGYAASALVVGAIIFKLVERPLHTKSKEWIQRSTSSLSPILVPVS